MYEKLDRLIRRAKYSGKLNPLGRLTYNPEESTFRDKDVDYVVMDGCKFKPCDQLGSLVRPVGPWFEKVRETDIVVDIGAGIGSVAIPLARKAKMVYAIEPLYWPELADNIVLNEITNIRTLPLAIGPGSSPIEETMWVEYGPRKAKVSIYPFELFRRDIGDTIDFLKIDCEGCEWEIPISAFEDIRELRIEFHIRRGEKSDFREFLSRHRWLIDNHYEVEVERNKHPEFSLLFKEIVYLIASRR